MNASETLSAAFGGILANKLRSALTTLGILIGVGSVILLVAVGNGSSKAIQANLYGSFSNALTQLSNSREAVRKEAAKMSELLNSIHISDDARRLDNPLVDGVAPEQTLAAREPGY